MMTWIRTPAVAALLLAIAGPASEAPATAAPTTVSDAEYADLDAYLSEQVGATRTPGLGVAVVDPDGPVHIETWGVDGDAKPVTPDTLFLWGSVAKPVTATAVMTLVEDGRLDLDETVQSHLPEFELADADASSRITVRHLLEQTSGMPEYTPVTDQFDDTETGHRQAFAQLADVQPVAEPGERHVYSSANYLVAGAVVAAVTGQDYDDYLRDHVLGPLQMESAVTGPAQAEDVPRGHRYVYGRAVAFDTPYAKMGASYGYLGGSLRDLARFARAQLAGVGGDPSVVSASGREAMQTGAAAVSEHTTYGLGWRVTTGESAPGTPVIWHGGAAPGYQAMVVLLPELDRAVVVTQNAYGFLHDAQLASVGLNAAAIVAGQEPKSRGGTGSYPAVLVVLTALVAAMVTLWVRWTQRLLRPRPVRADRFRRGRRVLGLLSSLALLLPAVAVAWWAPDRLGVSLPTIWLWAPDIAALIVVLAAGGALLAVTRLLVVLRRP